MDKSTPKILIAFGTRPEVIKIAPVIKALQQSGLQNELIVVNTEQQEHLIKTNLELFDIQANYHLEIFRHSNNLSEMLAHTLLELQKIITRYPSLQYLVVQGDTNTSLATAHLAYFNKLKLVHIEAGLRSHDLQDPFPEEFNRIVASKIAHVHFAPSAIASKNLEKEKVPENKILISGNTIVDAVKHVTGKTNFQSERRNKNLVLITLHRKQNLNTNYSKLLHTISDLAEKYVDLNFLWVVHPNSVQIAEDFGLHHPNSKISFSSPIPYNEFLQLYERTKLIITDSGGLQEEATLFGIPLIVFRQKTERQEPVADNYPLLISTDENEIRNFFAQHLNISVQQKDYFGHGYASKQIADWFKNQLGKLHYDTVIIGGGPAGTGPLIKAMKDGNLSVLLDKGIAIVEGYNDLMKGTLTKYNINSDTLSNVFLECLEGMSSDCLNKDELADEIDGIKFFLGKSIPLSALDKFLQKTGRQIENRLNEHPKCGVFKNTSATKIEKDSSGNFKIYLDKYEYPIFAKHVILATGGKQSEKKNTSKIITQDIDLKNYASKTILSDSLLSGNYDEYLNKLLPKNNSVVILGGSHSAFSSAWYLLSRFKQISFSEASLKIRCNDLPKIYFNNKEEALQFGYKDFTERDICVKTGKVFRLAGLRMDGRELYMRIIGMIDKHENRADVKLIHENTSILREELSNASCIISALGYEFSAIPVNDEAGNRIAMLGESTGHWVNEKCELLDSKNQPVDNLYAVGLATGFVPKGNLGGEESFNGQTNGLWYYQNDIAQILLNNIIHENTSTML